MTSSPLGVVITVFLFLLFSLPSTDARFSWNHAPNVIWAMGCDFINHDIGSQRVPGEQCTVACERHPGCTHFSWTTFQGGTCWFKRLPGVTTSAAIPNSLPGTVCGILNHGAPTRPPTPPPTPPPRWMRYNRGGKTITRTASFSEESPYSGRQTSPIAGIICSGSFCDNKQLVVVRDGSSTPVLNSHHWTRWFSEEHPSWADCPRDMIVNELQCKGRFCDAIRLQCGRLGSNYRVDTSDIRNVNWFSEEQGERLCPDGYYFWGMACRGRFCDGLKLNCAKVEYRQVGPPRSRDILAEAARFAPIYFFDKKAAENCVPDWPSSANNNKCKTSFLRDTPSFVEHDICGSDDVYTYWLWYGKQNPCDVTRIFDKGHDNDWEHISVFVRDGLAQRVTYFQHKGQYSRRRGTFSRSGERPWVYIGKTGHGSYHTDCDGVCGFTEFFGGLCVGSVNYCHGGCGYWEDFRNPGRELSASLHHLQPGQYINGITRPNRGACVEPCHGPNARLQGTSGCWQNTV